MLRHSQEIEEIPDESGTFWDGDAVSQGDAAVGFSVDTIVTYEDLVWWLLLALDGTITPAGDGGSPIAYTYPAVPDGGADDLRTATFEYGWGALVYRATRVVVNRMTVSCDRASSNVWRMTADLMARDVAKISNFTAAIPERTREAVKARGTKLFIDEPGGTIGTTQVLNKWRSWSWTLQNNVEEKYFGEGNEFPAVDFARGKQLVTGEVVMEHTDDVEYEKQRLLTARKLRFQQEGSQIHGGTVVNKRLRLDLGNAYWNAPAENAAGENLVQSFGFVGKPLAGAAPMSVETVNALATLP